MINQQRIDFNNDKENISRGLKFENLLNYDEEKAKKLRAERKRELYARINEAYLRNEREKGNLKYSMIPEKYKNIEFTDLIINKYNKKIIETMTEYVKYYEKKIKGICLIGDYGIGKTSLVAITCRKLIETRNLNVYFSTEQSILEEMKRTFNDSSLDTTEDVIRRIVNHDVVVIDELGTTSNEWELSTIKRIIDGAIYNNSKLFATSNYKGNQLLEKWGQSDIYKTPKQVLDRMNEAMDLIMIGGESFRNNKETR